MKTSIETVASASLPRDWSTNPEATCTVGSDWLRSMRSALLRIPSAILPATYNVLLNPAHPDSKQLKVTRTLKYPFDVRLKR